MADQNQLALFPELEQKDNLSNIKFSMNSTEWYTPRRGGMNRINKPKRLNEILRGKVIESIEVGPENCIIHVESGLQVEVYLNQFFDGDMLLQDVVFQIEVTDQKGAAIEAAEV